MPTMTRFPILFSPGYALFSRLVLLPPGKAYVEVDTHEVQVRMAWAFSARFPRSAIRSVTRVDRRPLSRGVHGLGGRWLVNGSADNLLALTLEPEQQGRVLGLPVSLHELWVSVVDPDGLTQALRG
jgi:hypothetical protein